MSDDKTSYSQSGEDIIIDFIFDTLQIETRRYLDVGAHDPKKLSNTYYFYEAGHNGVFVEPDPDLYKTFSKVRPKDKGINAGIGADGEKKATFYLMEPSTLNTFSKHEADVYQQFYSWVTVRGTKKIKLLNINDVLEKYFPNGADIVSIDVEGLDEKIVRSIDFSTHRPTVLCIETAVYEDGNTLKKNQSVIKYLKDNDYFVYADTFVNTLFVDYKVWKKQGRAVLEDF